MKKWVVLLRNIMVSVILGYLLLLIPDRDSKPELASRNQVPFEWNRDTEWQRLEKEFSTLQANHTLSVDSILSTQSAFISASLQRLVQKPWKESSDGWDSLLTQYMHLAPYVAMRPASYDWYVNLFSWIREIVKRQSIQLSPLDNPSRTLLYKLIYGMRSASEEVLLQLPPDTLFNRLDGMPEKSCTDSTQIFGITVHSGDILVSRGGADVSAFIARGNDYPGNFSHIALCYVDSITKKPFLIEAHIEKGVAISTVAEYVKDKKRRFMVLRLRSDLPAMRSNPRLPHQAARYMYELAQAHHIPYDFTLDPLEPSAMFCSEVASTGYAHQGVIPWQYPSVISAQGIRTWLHDFGVDHFRTQMPSDLEYDPQFTVVAEWRDSETLFLDHVDNAVMDAWYEQANAGMRLGYNRWKLPLARLIKGWCMLLNRFGKAGLIPEGMSATQALRNERFSSLHATAKKEVWKQVEQFRAEKGYRPPYWQLLRMARESVQNTRQ